MHNRRRLAILVVVPSEEGETHPQAAGRPGTLLVSLGTAHASRQRPAGTGAGDSSVCRSKSNGGEHHVHAQNPAHMQHRLPILFCKLFIRSASVIA